MKHKIRNTVAVAALAAAATLAAPAAANATIYPPSNACSVVPRVVAPGATVTFSCTDGTFEPGAFVSVTIEGNTAVDFGFVKMAVTSTGTATATDSGALEESSITFPTDASGVYNITATSSGSAGGTASVTVSTDSTAGGSDGGLATTGLDSSSLLGLWVGGGALVLAGGAIAVGTAVRRNRKSAEA